LPNHDFASFMRQRSKAAAEFVRGNAEPVADLSTREQPATFFGPMGGHVDGAERVRATYETDAARFHDGESTFEVLHQGASGDLGYWVGLQHAQARVGNAPGLAPMALRVTEIFRWEGDGWKLIHRHADMLAEATSPPPAAQPKGGSR
jgi:ketosteroid isomerase-like protein